MLVFTAVFHQQGDPRFVLAHFFQLAVFQRLAQPAQLTGGLGQVHVNRVQLADGRQGLRLVGGHQRPGGHRGAADAAADGGFQGGVVQVGAGAAQRRPGRRHLGFVFAQRRFRLVILLLAHRFHIQQLLEALGAQPGGFQGRLGARQLGPGALHVRLVEAVVDAVERLAFFHQLAFLEQPLLDDAVDLRTHLGHLVRGSAPGQLAGDGERLRFNGNKTGFRRRPVAARLVVAAAGRQGETEK